MKTKNNLTTGILLGIGVVVLPLILMSSSTSSSNNGIVGTPESHVWEIYLREGTTGWLLNKKTGEVKGLQAASESIFIPRIKDRRK